MQETFPIGIEEELQIISPLSGELANGAEKIMQMAPLLTDSSIKAETHQCMLEIATGVCRDTQQAYEELAFLRQEAMGIATRCGYCLSSSGSHPFTRWRDVALTVDEHVQNLEKRLGDILRANVFFGLHVHIGISDREAAVEIMNRLLPYIPVLLAISVNSPYFEGGDTGFDSYRALKMLNLPVTGPPPYFRTFKQYGKKIDLMMKLKQISDPVDILWDIRAHAIFETVEIRIFDAPVRAIESACIAGLLRALVMKLYNEYRDGAPFTPPCPKALLENRMRAAARGMGATFIDPSVCSVRSARESALEILEIVPKMLKRNESDLIRYTLRPLIENETGAMRQRRLFAKNRNFQQVVNFCMKKAASDI